MASELKKKTIIGLFWSAIERFGAQSIQFVLGIILARLLMPSDYGLVGMLAIFTAIAQSLIDSGFNSALIRTKNTTNDDFSTVFWFNLIISILLYLILFFLSPFIADFYNQYKLILLTRVLTLILIINALSAVHKTRLTKSIDFKSQAKVTTFATLIGGTIGISCAILGMGVWALVIQALSRAVLACIGLWLMSKWRPDFLFSIKSFTNLFSFGSRLLISSLLNSIYQNIYTIIIGRVYSAGDLGFYTRAKQFRDLPISSTYGIMQRVTYPVLSELQNEHDKLIQAYRKFIKMISYLIFPIMGFLWILAFPLIEALLGIKWIGSAHLLRIIVIIGALYPISAINLNILNVKGRSDLFLRLEVIKKILITIALLITYKINIEALLWGQVLVGFIGFYLNTYYTKKIIDFGFFNQIKDMVKPLLLVVISVFLVFMVSLVALPALPKLLIEIVTGACVYSLLFWFFAKEERNDIVKLVRIRKI